MVLFSFSDLLIASTLILNAIALVASPPRTITDALKDEELERSGEFRSGELAQEGDQATIVYDQRSLSHDKAFNVTSGFDNGIHVTENEPSVKNTETSIKERCIQMLRAVRRLSCIIVLWNIFFVVLMLFVLPG